MERLKGLDHLNEDLPNRILVDLTVALLVLHDFLVQVTVVQEVHHDTETRSGVLEKGLFVTDDTAMSSGTKKDQKSES